ncbi:5-oxoprolinase subunit PxpB [Motiliproteus sp. MSK22-1]|uniref:5-oxoprolinase subunit PxpB n=1 Tax=Motiliproteus sp. MSK22-1 TaxID=1897630 RepID=UPI0009762813|nr:5-oxoprolinase subunit PxpB [Motiliproteus sp. MSK22-1]OMH33897.1 allophanate hydrolase [Motiliproteus sp. MSK22-1]
MKIQPLSEDSLIVYMGDGIDRLVARKVKAATYRIRQDLFSYVVDIIPSYNSIHLTYDLTQADFFWFHSQLRGLLADIDGMTFSDQKGAVIEIPVYYGDEVALDIADIVERCHLSRDEIVTIHSQQLYTVYAIGFSPGFAYLGNTDQRIAMPRKNTPRLRVPAGSLGIADTQTAIYPSDSPGGWQILGRTPIELLDFQKSSLTPMDMGDLVKFVEIDRKEYLSLGGRL